MITLINYPPQLEITPGIYTSLMPVYNAIEWTVSSDNVNECNFKYICDIYIENGGVGFVKRLKLFPNQNGEAAFKINRVLEDYIVNNPKINLTNFVVNDNKCLEYYLSFGEEYDTSINCDQQVTVYPDLLESELNYAWNAAMQYREFSDYLYTNHNADFFMNPSSPGKFLTHSPERILIGMGDEAELSFLNMPGIGNYGGALRVEGFDRNDSPVNSTVFNNPYSNVVDYNNIYVQIPVGPYNFNTMMTTAFIDSNTEYYRVSLESVDSAQLLNNPTVQYLGGPGTNSWNTDSYPGCSTSFGITVANKIQFIMPDASCGQTLVISYQDGAFIEGQSYTVTFNVDNINNPSGEAQSVTVSIGGNTGTAHSGTGTFTDTIVAGPGGVLELIGYFDADTGGFGSHSFSIDLVEMILEGGVRTSEYKYYEIDRRKTNYKPMRFRWLNQLGGFDSYAFNLAQLNQLSITRTEYDKLMPAYHKIGDRGRQLTSVKAVEKVTVSSNWLTEEESNWLSELYTSVEVFKQDTCPIYHFHNITSLSVNTVFYLSCPMSQQEMDNFLVKIIIDKCDKTINIDLDGYKSGGDVLDRSRIRIFYTASPLPIIGDCGILYMPGVTLKQDPIIITSSSYDFKVKQRTKNINQFIEFEYAFDKNIQRN